AIGALAIAPSSTTTLYVGTGEPNGSGDSFFGVGLYRIDNAETTADLVGPINPLVATGIPNTPAFTGRAVSSIAVDPAHGGTSWVTTMTGIAGIGATGFGAPTQVPPLGLLGLYKSTNATSALGSITFNKVTVTGLGSLAPDTSGNSRIFDVTFEPGNTTNML